MEYSTTVTHAALVARLRAAKRPFLTTHFKPDGDAMGSVLALARALRSLGTTVDAVLAGPVDRAIRGLALEGEIRFVDHGLAIPSADCDVAVVLDTGAWSQLEHCRDWLKEHPELVVGIDHHARGDAVAPMRIVDRGCASCTQVLVAVIDEMGVPFGPSARTARNTIAEAIFVGLATDTGWFRFSAADDRVFQLAARLLTCGVDKDGLYRTIEQGDAPGRPLLTGRALNSLSYACGGRVAIMRLMRSDFAETGTRVDDLAGLVNEPMGVREVDMSVLLVESDPQLVKASFRSKPAANAGGAFIDVNHLAAHFDGGGHVHAAGARIPASMDEAVRLVLEACAVYLEDTPVVG